MARDTRARHGLARRILALSTLVLAAGGLLALEHTATGATTVKPSQAHEAGWQSHTEPTSKHDGDKGEHDGDKGEHDGDKGKHDEGEHDRHCNDGHGRDKVKNKHCRPASGD
jgi:hypothetical protein